MTIQEIIEYLYPNAVELENYEITNGQISYWNEGVLGPQPTQAELDTARKPVAAQLKKQEFARRSILDMDGIFADMNLPDNKIIYEILQEVMANPDGTKSTNVKAVRAKRVRGYGNVDTLLERKNTTVEDIQAMRWEDQ